MPVVCGACGVECAQGQTCVAGVCDYPAVAACYWSGQLIGFNPDTGVTGPLSDIGNNPGPLARLDATVLVADGTDKVTLSRVPALDEVPYPVTMEPNLVVEFYSR